MYNSRVQTGDLVLVSGVSGYVGSWLAKVLLDRGFRVRGTVRKLPDATSDSLRSVLPGVELVAADLREAREWPRAVDGCRWVFHVASPQAVKTERDHVAVATAGTRALLTAAFARDGLVEKVVLTSSEAAVTSGHGPRKQRFTEDDWADLGASTVGAYARSKTEAELLAWRMQRDAETNPRGVALTTILPGWVLGPSLVPGARFSLGLMKDLAEGKIPMLPDITSAIVDVRDCVDMHVALMQDRATDGKRYFCVAKSVRFADVAKAVHAAKMGFTPPLKLAPKWLMAVLRFASSDVAELYPKLGTNIALDSREPGPHRYAHTDVDTIVRETLSSMAAHKILAPRA